MSIGWWGYIYDGKICRYNVMVIVSIPMGRDTAPTYSSILLPLSQNTRICIICESWTLKVWDDRLIHFTINVLATPLCPFNYQSWRILLLIMFSRP